MAIDFKPAFMAKLNVEDIFKVIRDEAHRQYGPEAEVNINFTGTLQDSSLAAIVTVATSGLVHAPAPSAEPAHAAPNGAWHDAEPAVAHLS